MKRDVEKRVATLAARQKGVVTRAQLVEAGLSESAVERRLSVGSLRRIHRGVYLVGPIAPPGAWELAAVLAADADALVSHLSAGRRFDLLAKRGPPVRPGGRVGRPTREPVDITVVGANRGRRPGIRVHRVARLDPDERTVHDGIPITAPGRTLVDLAGMVGSRELERAVARAERAGRIGREELAALVVRHKGKRGIRMLREVLKLPGGPALTRSEAEDRFLALVREAGLPSPEANVVFGRYEIDFLWRKDRIAVEVDGYQHHSSRGRFEGDRRKDAWLLAQGIKVVRLSWRQIVGEGVATIVQLSHALSRPLG